jgi:hypothetical protein
MFSHYAALYSTIGCKEKSMTKQGDSCGDQAHRLAISTIGKDAEKIKVPKIEITKDNFKNLENVLNEKKEDFILRINIEEIDKSYTRFEHAYVAICINKKIAIYQSFMGKFDTFQWLNDEKSKNFMAIDTYSDLLKNLVSEDNKERTTAYGILHNLTNGNQGDVPPLTLKYEITDFCFNKACILLDNITNEIKEILEKNPFMSEKISEMFWVEIKKKIDPDLCEKIKDGVRKYNLDPMVQNMEKTFKF